MGDDLGVGSIKFSVTRAFQQDQIVLLGIKIDVRSYHSQGCFLIKNNFDLNNECKIKLVSACSTYLVMDAIFQVLTTLFQSNCFCKTYI